MRTDDGTSYDILTIFLVILFVFQGKLEVIQWSCQWFEEFFVLFSFESLQFSFI